MSMGRKTGSNRSCAEPARSTVPGRSQASLMRN
jgi:hypothetical protein